MAAMAALAALAALGACATQPAPPPPPPAPPPPVVVVPPVTKDPATGIITAPAGADVAIDAPKAGAVALDLRKADAGKTFTMKVGERVSVSLVGTPTAGYLWAAPNPPVFLKLAGETSGPTHTAQLQPGFTGGDHWEVTSFVAVAKGKGDLVFEQRRPWEKNEPPADTWRVTIDVR
jgi:predicted secreted protein